MDTELDPEQVRDGLEQAGLTSYQADAYITLLERGAAPAVDVAKNCSVPVPRIYDVLKDLEQEGYIETFEQDTLHARALDPVEVIDDLHSRSELLSDTASAIEDAWERASLSEHKMSVVKHAETVFDHAEELIRDATSTVELAATREQVAELESALASAADNGAVVRVSLYVDDGAADPGDLPTDVAEVRRRSIPGPFLAVVDRTHTCFAPDDRTDEPYGVILNDYILSFIFHWYYQTCLWSVWEPVDGPPTPPVQYVSLEGFIRDLYPLWYHGATVSVTVSGLDTETGEPVEVSGVVEDPLSTGMDVHSATPPSYGQLAGQSTVRLATEDGPLLVGGWGAVFEDVEAQRIALDGVVLDAASVTAVTDAYLDGGLPTAIERIAPVVTTA